ncbi:S-adenosyl-L-methionine-dependent methyltransferase [Hesseltinella vesiculosa]|uniref:peptide chain release factor N(5)-glutamine methyltransferase n=1 Tax=Hesseltinella vesiculosa TaxID=101127 RepID=A0A1X2GV20_9FUNG|nr:S-adenosyl-L-methionine-dependent methyltransferase [Hesseltinella vesiculosa]
MYKDMPLDIVYQEHDLVVAWKPPGMSFHTFELILRYRLEKEPELMWLPFQLQKAASGLMMVATSQASKEDLSQKYMQGQIQLELHAICHGLVPEDVLSRQPEPPILDGTTTLDNDHQLPSPPATGHVAKRRRTLTKDDFPDDDEENDDDDDDDIDRFGLQEQQTSPSMDAVRIHSVIRSNNADYLTTVVLQVHTPFSSGAIRHSFCHRGHPIIGNSNATRPLKTHRDKGLYMSLTRITLGSLQLVHAEPDKFQLLRQREHRFWQRAYEKRLAVVQQSGKVVDDDLEWVENAYGKEPIAYLLGEKMFHGLRFDIDRSCLIPRPSSETLVTAALDWLNQQTRTSPRVLDLGTGCGNLMVSILASMPTATGVGVDISAEALIMAEKNLQSLVQPCSRGRFICKDMAQLTLDDLHGPMDILVCNPPYLDKAALDRSHLANHQKLQLAHEPDEALFADDQGYAWYKAIHDLAPHWLAPHSCVILECGKGMMKKVRKIWCGWQVVHTVQDKQGWDRCLVLEKK